MPIRWHQDDPALLRGLQDNFLTNQDELWSRYHGFEAKVEKRFANGGTLQGGFTAGRNRGRTTGGDLNNPNNLINAVGAVGFDATYQLNLAGSWILPFDILIAGSVRTATGLPLSRTYTVTRSIVPTLTQVSQSVNLVPRGEYRLQNNNLVDLRVSKILRFAGVRLEGIADIYNLLNSNATTGEVQTVGPALGRPSAILEGRILRLGVQMTF